MDQIKTKYEKLKIFKKTKQKQNKKQNKAKNNQTINVNIKFREHGVFQGELSF